MKHGHLTSASLALALATLALHLGWARGERPWRMATGFARIPRDLRPPSDLPWPPGAGLPPRLSWLGHAGFLLEWEGRRLLVDPNLASRCTLARRQLERAVEAADLGAIDALLVTHAHYDHLDLATIAALERVDRLLVPAGSESYVIALRADARVEGMSPGSTLAVGPLEITAVPALHHGHRHHPLASRKIAVGWIVRSAAGSIYFAGDTGAGNDFGAIAVRYRPILAVLPIGAFSPPWPIGRVHLSPEQAVEVAERLGGPLVVPSHFGTFALALDQPSTALPRFARAAARAGIAWRMPRLAQGPLRAAGSP